MYIIYRAVAYLYTLLLHRMFNSVLVQQSPQETSTTILNTLCLILSMHAPILLNTLLNNLPRQILRLRRNNSAGLFFQSRVAFLGRPWMRCFV